MKVGLLLIATNKYVKFIPDLIKSADEFFLLNEKVERKSIFGKKSENIEVVYHIFTDDTNTIIETNRKVIFYKIEHKPWPLVTLGRYETFFRYKWDLMDMDYLFYCDIDMKFVSNIGKEILSKRVATLHPGYVGTIGTPESNTNSKSYYKTDSNSKYYAGGFNGGESTSFLKMSSQIHFNILSDLKKNIIAVWHDESHLNAYFNKYKPTNILDPGYCYPESKDLPYEKKLLALDKDHKSVRGDKCGVIIFHKNIKDIYKKRWVDRCLESIINQTYNDYKVYEVNYGNDDFSLVRDYELNGVFYKKDYTNHVDAMNFIIDEAFKDDCDYIFNINLDDYYDIYRFQKQLETIKRGYDVVSSDFVYITEQGNLDIVTKYMYMSDLDIKNQLNSDNNIIAHPCVCFNKRFWKSNRYVSNEIPREDLNIWKRGINSGFNFFIIRDILLYYRIHDKQITSNERRN